MKAILHAGMQKTGSSSIQDTLAQVGLKQSLYIPWRNPNHGTLVAVLFEEGRAQLHGMLRAYEEDPEALAMLRRRTRRELDRALQDKPAAQVILSAERMFGLSPEYKTRIRTYFEQHCDEIEVICYIRPPASLIQSAFQQMLKRGKLNRLNHQVLKGRWPSYQRNVEAMDQVFGAENVKLVKFDRKTLFKQDVVLDFAQRIGEDLNAEDVVRTNESVSLEAAALLFLYRQTAGSANKATWAKERRHEKRIVEALRNVGSSKLVLSKALINPVLEDNRKDLSWIEGRLGESLVENADETDRAVSTEADFLKVAKAARDGLEVEIARQEKSGCPDKVLAILRRISEDAAAVKES